MRFESIIGVINSTLNVRYAQIDQSMICIASKTKIYTLFIYQLYRVIHAFTVYTVQINYNYYSIIHFYVYS